MPSIQYIRRQLIKSHRKTQNWRTTAALFGLTSGTAFRIAERNYEPKDPHIRHALGLPALLPAPACPRCGSVHVSKRCTRLIRERRRLIDIPVDELRRMIENREEIK